MSARIAVVGGGPGGLFAAALIQRRLPAATVELFERNDRADAFGFGVVFSDATLREIDAADPVLRDALARHGTHWNRIEVWRDGERHGFGGNGMAAIHRRVLLGLLQRNAEAAGVTCRYGEPAPTLDRLAAGYDVVIGADGTNSGVREQLLAQGADLGHDVQTAAAKFIWFGTTYLFDGLTFVHRASEHGHFAVHGYPISADLSTFIVETDEDTWRSAGLDGFDITAPAGPSDETSQRYLTELFAPDVEGHELVANNSRWGSFRTRSTTTWHDGNVVLLGDSVHTAHFSVGSGTKMAMEDAVVLADRLAQVYGGDELDLADALADFERVRRASVEKIQGSARPSLSWWERFGAYSEHLDPLSFAFHFFSRSIAVDRIERRDAELVDAVRRRWVTEHGAPVADTTVTIGGSQVRRILSVDQVPFDAVQVVEAPDRELDVTATVGALRPGTPVLVRGGTPLTRVLVSESARMERGLASLLEGSYSPAEAETLLLAGRADAVAVVDPVPAVVR
jgi:salicyloyl-CoA 5-hydroxylase